MEIKLQINEKVLRLVLPPPLTLALVFALALVLVLVLALVSKVFVEEMFSNVIKILFLSFQKRSLVNEARWKNEVF